MKRLVLALSAVALVSGAAFADPIADRKALMKERGGLVGQLAPIAKGEKPFDAAAVLAALQGLAANGEKFDVDALFPAGSDSGDTKASPKIWEDMAGFKAAEDKFEADVAAALAAPAQDLDAFKAQFGAIAANCGACHQTYRLPQS
ncbi:MAG TPA: cytochrome c [Rhizobiales bacterium]|nr:cytochrome c [Hyphomicrobiales bacterium]